MRVVSPSYRFLAVESRGTARISSDIAEHFTQRARRVTIDSWFSTRVRNSVYTSTMVKYAVLVLLVSASLAFGQLDSNSVTVTASLSVNLQPDEAIFGVYVDSDLHAALSDVLAPLQGSGITVTNFSVVSTVQRYDSRTGMPLPAMLEWAFRFPVALSKTKDTASLLAALQQNLVQKNKGLELSFNLQGTQVSDQLQQSHSCVISDLIAAARISAQRLANAAGLGVGAVLAMLSQAGTAPNCSLTVKFALGRF